MGGGEERNESEESEGWDNTEGQGTSFIPHHAHTTNVIVWVCVCVCVCVSVCEYAGCVVCGGEKDYTESYLIHIPLLIPHPHPSAHPSSSHPVQQ